MVGTASVFNTEPTPVIWVGLLSEDTFNAVVGCSGLLFAVITSPFFNSTGFLPFAVSPTFTVVNSTLSFVENVNLPSA